MTARDLLEEARRLGLILSVNESGGLRINGKPEAVGSYTAQHREMLAQEKRVLIDLVRGGDPETWGGRSSEEIARAARLEFALAYRAKIEAEFDPGVPEWLEWAFWCLFYDAMEGFVRWGLGEHWPQVREGAEDQSQAAGMRERALENWAGWHRERERHSARWNRMTEEWISKRDELMLNAESWAWRAFLTELARHNPEAESQEQIDPWVDLRPWALYLTRWGRDLRLVWSDKEAA